MRVTDVLSVAAAMILISAELSLATTTMQSPVDIRIFGFTPGQLEVNAGTTVTWTNHDEITHTVTSGTPDTRDGHFRQRLEGKGRAVTVVFKERGVYPYFCERHPSMRGEIRVH
jgi:plastocyanin